MKAREWALGRGFALTCSASAARDGDGASNADSGTPAILLRTTLRSSAAKLSKDDSSTSLLDTLAWLPRRPDDDAACPSPPQAAAAAVTRSATPLDENEAFGDTTKDAGRLETLPLPLSCVRDGATPAWGIKS